MGVRTLVSATTGPFEGLVYPQQEETVEVPADEHLEWDGLEGVAIGQTV